MEQLETLKQHGLFDAKVPRYTSYPPANHFENDVGRHSQLRWMSDVGATETISLYVHIPFCRRLCWFCACRTQGTKTMRPVDAYIEVLKTEIATARLALPQDVRVGRLHLGGGTPTLLSGQTMASLLRTIFNAFNKSDDFEFSVEIDPTEASDEVLSTLITHGMNRASIGVQDFAPKVQKAIGRPQSLEQTKRVINYLRNNGVDAINLDLLYGLPFQTQKSFERTLSHVVDMAPDRLAIYGYAHVPWMSKRQVLIKSETLPNTQDRFTLAQIAQATLDAHGYDQIGIDHFARPSDSLARAAKNGTLRRNFQGYTDDPHDTLIGFGASAISRFRQGYVQNAVATSAYLDRINDSGFAGHKGFVLSPTDTVISTMIERLMCDFDFPTMALQSAYPALSTTIRQTAVALMAAFPGVFTICAGGIEMRPEYYPLVRIIAKFIDTYTSQDNAHAAAI